MISWRLRTFVIALLCLEPSDAFATHRTNTVWSESRLKGTTSDDCSCPDDSENYRKEKLPLSRRGLFFGGVAAAAATFTSALADTPSAALAAPPISIIAEELGYFPVTNRKGETVYVPKTVQRSPSSDQATKLARKLKDKGVVMVGTYWCPHTSRQKELFGKEAWQEIPYVECSPKGYQGNPSYCIAKQVDGYPAWIFPKGKILSGERPLSVLAQEIGFKGFDESLEQNVPPLPGAACK